MASQQVQSRQASTEKKRYDVRAQHAIHPEHDYQTIKLRCKSFVGYRDKTLYWQTV